MGSIEVSARWEVPFSHDIGETSSKFLIELRDHARIMGTKCPECGRVFLPPRAFCERCFIPLKDHWVELEPRGTLEAFTIVTDAYAPAGLPRPPYVICLVKLGGSDTAIPQTLQGLDLSDPRRVARELKVGAPVKAVFKENREGRITDFHIELMNV
ncbi:MAG: Zn-ribbon domain-containing OB-fold protein [Chloroflexi bacterium]|nr:Zn-ribbon domain-containing OB-fold protein [Chloroflexota bacterium]